MKTSKTARTKRNTLIFIVVVLAAGWIGRLIDLAADADPGQGPGLLLWILAPVATGLILRAAAGDGWKDFGIKPNLKGNGRWYALALFFYPIVIGVTILAGLSFGGFIPKADGVLPIAPFVAALGIGLAPAFFKNIGEEFGWRGYLVPRLAGTGINRWKLHLIVGAVWAGWHLPYLSTFWTYTEEGMATLVPRFFLGTIVAAVVFGEIRLATGSVWPAVVMHTIGNAVATGVLADGVLQLASTSPILFFPSVEGVAMILLTAVVAFLIVKARKAGATEQASDQVPLQGQVGIDESATKVFGAETARTEANV